MFQDEEQDAAPGRRPGNGGEAPRRAGRTDEQRHSRGVPASGRHEIAASGPAGGPGVGNRQEATIARPGLDDRGGVFFAAAEMTRMPMVVTDPNLPDNPIVFANRAFQDLTGYTEEEILGRNCRFLQGAQTDREVVREALRLLEEKKAATAARRRRGRPPAAADSDQGRPPA